MEKSFESIVNQNVLKIPNVQK